MRTENTRLSKTAFPRSSVCDWREVLSVTVRVEAVLPLWASVSNSALFWDLFCFVGEWLEINPRTPCILNSTVALSPTPKPLVVKENSQTLDFSNIFLFATLKIQVDSYPSRLSDNGSYIVEEGFHMWVFGWCLSWGTGVCLCAHAFTCVYTMLSFSSVFGQLRVAYFKPLLWDYNDF